MNNQPTQPGKLPEEVQKNIEAKALSYLESLYDKGYVVERLKDPGNAPNDWFRILSAHKNGQREYAEKWWEVSKENKKLKEIYASDLENTRRLLVQNQSLQQENEKLKAALEWIKTYGPVDKLTVQFIDKALASYGKEGQNG